MNGVDFDRDSDALDGQGAQLEFGILNWRQMKDGVNGLCEGEENLFSNNHAMIGLWEFREWFARLGSAAGSAGGG